MSLKMKIILLCCLVAVSQAGKLGRPYIGFWGRPMVGRIVGGINADQGEFPHQISLQTGTPPNLRHRCGGSILNNRWILTAGHCALINVPAFYVKAGKHEISTVEKTEQLVKVEKLFIHEKYPGDVNPYDIALLKLQKPLVFNEQVQPIALPKEDTIPDGRVILSGWGSISGSQTPVLPDILQKANLPIVDLDTCKKAIESLTGPSPLHETNVCTGPLTGGISACSGDSGGPLMKVRADGKFEVIGIASWAIFPCGTKGAPSVFTRVSAFNKWIESTITNNS